ncbi:MAG TPA: hypothetical protein PK812_05955 [Beijerinckiaceae bacterium]|nr:hypothetical protein [Beijerinckiaceae bacterium]
MQVSLYGLGMAGLLGIGAFLARRVMLKALDNAEKADAKTLSPEQMAEKRKVRGVVENVLIAELLIMPILGYWIGHTYLTPR